MEERSIKKKGNTRVERYANLTKKVNGNNNSKKNSSVKKTNIKKQENKKISITNTQEIDSIVPMIHKEKPIINNNYNNVKPQIEKKKTKKHVKFKSKFTMCSFFAILLVLSIFAYKIIFNSNNKKNTNNVKEEEKKEVVEEPKEDVIEESEVSLIMVGDCLIHGSIYMDAKEGNTYNFYKMLDRIKPIVSSYDLAYYNQESILGGTSLGLQSYPRFNSPQEIGDAMLDAGFNIVTFANNHSLDMGEKGIIASQEYWDKKEAEGVLTAGSYTSFEDREKEIIKEKNGITYTILSYTTTTNGLSRPSGKDYLVNVYNPEQVKADIERLRDKVDLLMVAMHWGEEYTHTPNENQKEIAEYLASLGVDIIIGHHPHVIQPIDFIGNTMVIYSLGNFIASQKGEIAKHTGLMASVKIHKKTVNGKSSIELLEPTAQLEYVYSVPVSSNSRKNYKLYSYEELNDSLLKGYKDYYYKFMDIVTKYNKNILYKEI